MSEEPTTEHEEDDKPSGEEREQLAQEGRIKQTEDEESQEGA